MFGRLSTITSGYPQTNASYPHFYVDAVSDLGCAELLFTLFAFIVLEVERVDKLSEGRKPLLVGDLRLALFGGLLFERGTFLIFGSCAGALEDVRLDINRDISAHSQRDRVARASVNFDRMAA